MKFSNIPKSSNPAFISPAPHTSADNRHHCYQPEQHISAASSLAIGSHVDSLPLHDIPTVSLIRVEAKKFVHTRDAAFFLIKIWMYVQIECCRNIRVPE